MYGKLLLRYIVQKYVFISCSNYGYCTKNLYIVENFMSLRASHLLFYLVLLISTKLHIKHILIYIENEMEPFRRDDVEAFLADIIGTGTYHNEDDAAEDDGSQYLNDTGNGED